MEFKIKGPFNNSIYNLMRDIGYHYAEKSTKTGEISFTNPLRGALFPRFHMYVKVDPKTGDFLCDLHLDQKAPIYQGTTAHSGEYSGEIIEKEAERIQKILGHLQ